MRRLPCLLVEVGRTAHQQRPPVVAAEHAREHVLPLGRRDLVHDLAAGREPDAPGADLVAPAVSPTISVRPSGVITEPFGNSMSSAAIDAVPSGSIRSSFAGFGSA